MLIMLLGKGLILAFTQRSINLLLLPKRAQCCTIWNMYSVSTRKWHSPYHYFCNFSVSQPLSWSTTALCVTSFPPLMIVSIQILVVTLCQASGRAKGVNNILCPEYWYDIGIRKGKLNFAVSSGVNVQSLGASSLTQSERYSKDSPWHTNAQSTFPSHFFAYIGSVVLLLEKSVMHFLRNCSGRVSLELWRKLYFWDNNKY